MNTGKPPQLRIKDQARIEEITNLAERLRKRDDEMYPKLCRLLRPYLPTIETYIKLSYEERQGIYKDMTSPQGSLFEANIPNFYPAFLSLTDEELAQLKSDIVAFLEL
jgi:hypothetical protein